VHHSIDLFHLQTLMRADFRAVCSHPAYWTAI